MTTTKRLPIRRALLSVSDKTGLQDLAQALAQAGIEILSTGGTATVLRETGLSVREVSEVTEFPEIMAGRVKTLHPKIHGGLLGRGDQDAEVCAEHGIEPIDLLVVNLYPFSQTIACPDCTPEQAIENIDVGGPAMLRAAAKNHAWCCVVVDPQDYPRILEALSDGTDLMMRQDLATKAFEHTAAYDGAIASYLGHQLEPETSFGRTLNLNLVRQQSLRYGENPHQKGAFYRFSQAAHGTLASAQVHQGKELSYNNIADTDAAWECVRAFTDPACVIVKHANPCGVAESNEIAQAYEQAYRTDPTSAFGGIIAFNRPLDGTTAKTIVERQFVEVLIATDYTPEALETLATKPGIRVLSTAAVPHSSERTVVHSVSGGLLVQSADDELLRVDQLRTASKREPTKTERQDLLFAWQVAKFVKSNAIVYVRDRTTVGVGAGQMSRIYSARIAAIKAADENLSLRGSVMASDAFFPFRDGIDAAAEYGITAIIQPGGSQRDEEVIAAANEHGMAMLLTKMRHFRH